LRRHSEGRLSLVIRHLSLVIREAPIPRPRLTNDQ
jgi:hypothetical protein